jgi:hypothetical protein
VKKMATKSDTATKPATRKPTAKKTATASKPARTKKQPASKQPAATKPAKAEKPAEGSVSLKDLAEFLNREPKSLRASIRRIMGGPQVGKGGRYSWTSWDDEELKDLIGNLTKASANEGE